MLFALLSHMDTQAASLFGAMVQRGPSAIASLSPERQIALQDAIADAFRGAFLTIGMFAGISATLAWTTAGAAALSGSGRRRTDQTGHAHC